MINNRQGGRRRGRGGQRGQSPGGRPDGNRQDNRQRGNAAQLLEKYKSMARDSQLAGDRVQTEYFLQYADHYFRVLSESRSRFEEQRSQRGDDGEDQDGDEQMAEAADEESGDDRPERQERGERFGRRDRGRDERPRRFDRDDREPEDTGEPAEAGPQMNGVGETIPFDALPPAIGSTDEEPVEVAPKPRRRSRASRPADDDSDVAPAA